MQPQNTDNPGVQGLAPNELPQHVGNITQKQLKLKETPRKIGTPRATQNVTTQREDIVDQMENEMVLCQGWDETGFGHYLPSKHPVSDADVDAAVDALKQAGHLELDAADGDFQFTEIDPTAHGNETVIYSPLVKICEVLQDLSFADKRQVSCKIEQNPNNYNESETLGANFKVDAYLKLAHSTMPKNKDLGPVCDLAVPSEYKRDRTNVYENRKQLLGTTTFCMNDDPRRTHIFGITIEDRTMAVWYFSRSHSAKSPNFDFTKDCRRYIRVMLSLIFATEEELGYDSTIARRVDPRTGNLCFVYNVDKSYYKTERAIFDHRSLCMTGRATRVWAVVEVRSFDELDPVEGSTMALKDVWLDSKSITEDKIIEHIFDKLKRVAADLKNGNEEPKGFKNMDDKSKQQLRECLEKGDWTQYFLTIVTHSRGTTSKEMAQGASPDNALFRSRSYVIKAPSFPNADFSRSFTPHPANLVQVPCAHQSAFRHYSSKRQYRVVFKEVCQPLHDVNNLKDVATALLDCVFALQLLFLAGWVHRDVSSGNVYYFKDGGKERGILADLEYAKLFQPDEKGNSDPKTGTAFFMPVEIHTQLMIYKVPRVGQAVQPDPFHNFEHDMESLFWLFLWIVLVRFPGQRKCEEQRDFACAMDAIFLYSNVCTSVRSGLITSAGCLRKLLTRWLAQDLQPIAEPLVALCDALYHGYMSRELNFGDMSSYAGLYECLRRPLEHCLQLPEKEILSKLLPCNGNIDTLSVSRPRQVVKNRRPRTDLDDDEYVPSQRSGSTTASSSRKRMKMDSD